LASWRWRRRGLQRLFSLGVFSFTLVVRRRREAA